MPQQNQQAGFDVDSRIVSKYLNPNSKTPIFLET